MKYVTSKFLTMTVLAVVLSLSAPAASTALACPMCKAANEEDDAKPKAYMYSILFMLTVPATLVSGVTFSLFKMNRHEAEALLDAGLSDESSEQEPSEGSQG